VSFRLPPPSTVLELTMPDGAIIHVRRQGCSGGPRLVFSHGNGFAIDAYYPFWRHFLRDCEVIVFDQRNHGWNPLHHMRGHTERQMAEDMEVILQIEQPEYVQRIVRERLRAADFRSHPNSATRATRAPCRAPDFAAGSS